MANVFCQICQSVVALNCKHVGSDWWGAIAGNSNVLTQMAIKCVQQIKGAWIQLEELECLV